MPNPKMAWICFLLFFSIILAININLQESKPLFSSIKSTLYGPILLLALSAMTNYTSVELPINIISLGISSLLGMPGIASMAILNTVLK